MPHLLVVDDEPGICWGLEQLGGEMHWEVTSVSSAEAGLKQLRERSADVIMLDVRLPGMDGLEAFALFREVAPQTPIIVMTAWGSLETAVRAARTDAIEYLLKPFDLQTAKTALERAWQACSPAPSTGPDSGRTRGAATSGFAGNSPAMQAVYRRIALAAMSDIHVLLSGESGTGKELAAREIHRNSALHDKPFVAINVAALNPALAESELFGHVRGAFTGAVQSRPGLLAEAHGGTLFLDEVAEIPLSIQTKLLRAVEQGELLPVGSSTPVPVQFRIISASHRDLVGCIERGEFRHDLYFRLAGFRIDLPSLRSRPEDIEELARHFLAASPLNGETGPAGFSREALAELRRRDWPGNVRELRSAIGHAVVMARNGIIQPGHLPEPERLSLPRDQREAVPDPLAALKAAVTGWLRERLASPEPPNALHAELLALIEPLLFRSALDHARSQIAAARLLGLHRTTLKKRMDELGMESEGPA